MKYKSREIAVLNLEKLFSKSSSDSISVEEAYQSYDRNLEEKDRNANWLSNYLTHLKHYDLVRTIYTLRNSRRILDRIKLTSEGRRAIRREESFPLNDSDEKQLVTSQDNNYSFPDVMKIVAKLRQEHPEFQITFDVRLKE